MTKTTPVLIMLAALALLSTPAFAQAPNNPDKPMLSEEPVQPSPPPEPIKPSPPPDPIKPSPPPDPIKPPPEPASDLVTAMDPEGVLEAMSKLGFRAEMAPLSSGRPRMTFVASGANSSIIFYDCDIEMKGCNSLRFFHGLDFKSGVTPQKSNEWNRRQLHGRTYLDDDGDPWLDMMLVTGAGVPVAVFKQELGTWERIVGKFRTHFEAK